MMENEIEEVESTESGASEGSSPEASEPNSETPELKSQETKQDTTPFHEHPRFKELVEQKNDAQKRYQDMESRYKAIEQQVSSLRDSQSKNPTETDLLLEDLKKVDPRLANLLQNQIRSAQTTESVQKRLEEFERSSQESARQQVISSAVSKINSLHESNKMSDFGKQFINAQMDIAYRNGTLNASDSKSIETAYGESSKAIKAYEDSLKRATTESYVQDKKKDSQVPTSQPKGTPAKQANKKPEFSSDKDTAKAQVVARYLKQAAANRNADAV